MAEIFGTAMLSKKNTTAKVLFIISTWHYFYINGLPSLLWRLDSAAAAAHVMMAFLCCARLIRAIDAAQERGAVIAPSALAPYKRRRTLHAAMCAARGVSGSQMYLSALEASSSFCILSSTATSSRSLSGFCMSLSMPPEHSAAISSIMLLASFKLDATWDKYKHS